MIENLPWWAWVLVGSGATLVVIYTWASTLWAKVYWDAMQYVWQRG